MAKLEHNYEPRKNYDIFVRYLAPISESDTEDTLYTLQGAVASEATIGLRFFY